MFMKPAPTIQKQITTNKVADAGVKNGNAVASGSFNGVNSSATGVATRTGNSQSTPTLFGRGDKVGWQGQAPSQKGVLAEGTHLPSLDPQLASLFGKGNVFGGNPGMTDPNFTGQPTMYPVQQSLATDIFGDTAKLFEKRDRLQAEMDGFFAKNPLDPNDIGGNFAKVASMAGHRNQLKELGETLRNRDSIMGNMMGVMTNAGAGIQQEQIKAGASRYDSELDATSKVAAAGAGGTATDPMKGPGEIFKTLSELVKNPEALASFSPADQEMLKKMIPTYMNHFNKNFGVGVQAELNAGEGVN